MTRSRCGSGENDLRSRAVFRRYAEKRPISALLPVYHTKVDDNFFPGPKKGEKGRTRPRARKKLVAPCRAETHRPCRLPPADRKTRGTRAGCVHSVKGNSFAEREKKTLFGLFASIYAKFRVLSRFLAFLRMKIRFFIHSIEDKNVYSRLWVCKFFANCTVRFFKDFQFGQV